MFSTNHHRIKLVIEKRLCPERISYLKCSNVELMSFVGTSYTCKLMFSISQVDVECYFLTKDCEVFIQVCLKFKSCLIRTILLV